MMVRCSRLFTLVILGSCLVLPGKLIAATVFTPMSAAELQANLTTAQTTPGDIVIQLAAITYKTADNGNATFIYSSTQDNSITVMGTGIGSTILDGGSAQEPLLLANGAASLGHNITLQNLTIQNGEATDAGGLAIASDLADIIVDSVAFSGNHSTGGNGALQVSNDSGALTVSNCTFDTNSTDGDEGVGNFSTNTGALTLTQNSFTNNFINGTAGDEGVGNISTFSGPIQLNNNIFTNNRAGTASGNEGVVGISTSTGPITLTANTFTGNQAGTDIGDEGVFSVSTGTGNILLQDNTFTNNQAGANVGSAGVGGLITGSGSISLLRNTFTGNSAGGSEGALEFNTSDGNISLDSNTFTKNTAKQESGAFFISTSTGNVLFTNNIFDTNSALAGDGGGGAISTGGTIDIINNTLFGNSAAGQGGGLQLLPGDTGVVNIYNNIVFGNTAAQGNDLFVNNISGSTVSLFNNDFDSLGFCVSTPASCDPTVLAGNQGANINGAPKFIDTAAGNFNLGSGSPAIDTATASAPNFPTVDHDGNPRPFGVAPDMGALEAVPQLSVAPPTHDFGTLSVGANDSVIVTITNGGGVPANITGMTLSDGVNYNLDVNGGPNPCGSTALALNPGQSCTVAVIFLPGSEGTFDATLDIASDDPQNPTLQVTLTGAGTSSSGDIQGSGCSLAMGDTPSGFWTLGLSSLGILLWSFRRKS